MKNDGMAGKVKDFIDAIRALNLLFSKKFIDNNFHVFI